MWKWRSCYLSSHLQLMETEPRCHFQLETDDDNRIMSSMMTGWFEGRVNMKLVLDASLALWSAYYPTWPGTTEHWISPCTTSFSSITSMTIMRDEPMYWLFFADWNWSDYLFSLTPPGVYESREPTCNGSLMSKISKIRKALNLHLNSLLSLKSGLRLGKRRRRLRRRVPFVSPAVEARVPLEGSWLKNIS